MSTVYLVDTSAWIEYLRQTESETDLFLCELLAKQATIATTEPVIAEVLAGARGTAELNKLERLFHGLILLSVDNQVDYHQSATIFRDCRAKGVTVRKLYDCLIAAVALRADAVLVHYDRDFDHLGTVIPRVRMQRHNLN